MALKKDIRSDNTYIISQDTTDNPKLGAKILSDGRESLFLDYYFGYRMEYSEKLGRDVAKKDRKREYLSLYLWQAPRTPLERQQNKEMLEIAKRIRFERGQQMLESAEGYRLKKNDDINFWIGFGATMRHTQKADKRHIKRAYTVFIDFLKATPEYSKYAKRIKPSQLSKDMMLAFTDYLKSRFKGEGAHTLYARFKKVIKNAVEQDILRKNPCTGIIIKIDANKLTKDVLSIDEMQQLIATHYTGENPDIRRAFIFCLYCGLRWCDVKDLTYSNVDFANKLLRFEQAKTKGHSSASNVAIPLNDGLLNLIGEGDRGDLIFPLPSHTMCLKALRHWVSRAGIDKHITWHCARHSFAVNILNNGANIKTVASLLGHSGLKHTEKYTRAVDSLKQEAINSLPELKNLNMIDTTIEDKLFREFKYGGAAYLALEYVNIAHKKDGFDVYPKNWQEFYKIKLPQIVKSRTDSYDDVPLFVSVDGERPLMWIEIESNISSCKTENELNRYLYSLLLPFKEWSDSICPIRYIQHAQQDIERCKRDIPLHIARAESLEDGWDKDEAFADAEACKDSIKKDEERIKRLEGSHDRFLQIFNDAADRSVEWYCKAWFDVFCTYADNLDALLLKFGIDLYAVQDNCGIWLKPKRDVISIMGYVGTLELTQTLISQLPQNVNYPKQKELPPDLCTPKAMDVLKRAIVKGLLDENYMPTADMTKSQMKVFAIHASIECGFERRCYKPFETYWSVSNLAQTREVDGSDDKLEIVRNLFPKDVRKRAKHKNR